MAITIVKSKFGPGFGKKAKIVQEALLALQENEQEKVDEMKKRLEKEGIAKVLGADGLEYTIQSDMVSIAMQTKKTSGTHNFF